MEYEKFATRCQDCIDLKIKNGVWTCENCFGQKCCDITECPEGVTAEQVKATTEALKDFKIVHNSHSGKATVKESKAKQPDDEKIQMVQDITNLLQTYLTDYENVTITNPTKIIEFDFANNHYKIDIIRQRKSKNQ